MSSDWISKDSRRPMSNDWITEESWRPTSLDWICHLNSRPNFSDWISPMFNDWIIVKLVRNSIGQDSSRPTSLD